MLKKETSTLCFEDSTMKGGSVCDMCRSAPCTVFCRADLAYLCTSCDTRIHAANKLSSRHERVSVCKPYDPVFESHGLDDNDETASWLLFDGPLNLNQNSNSNGNNSSNINTNGVLCNGEEGVDEYLDLVEYNSCQDTHFSDDQYTTDTTTTTTNNNNDIQRENRGYIVPQKSYGGDSVVPIRFEEAMKQQQIHFQHQKFQSGVEYERSNAGYGYPAALGHSVSMSSLDVGIVPDSTIIEVSKVTIDLFSNPTIQMPTQLTPMDREARVLRYREKKKTRKFEKTIRYASRKAYAETRPRVKGRFAKRTNVDVDVEVDQMFSTSLMTEGGYCVVPSF